MAKKASKKKVEKESINESPENQVEDLKLEDQLKEEKDKFLRLFAEFENYKRRTAKERIELFSTASEEVMISLLPILDDFDRASVEIEKDLENETLKGVLLIKNKLFDSLKSKGLSLVDVKKGDEFNADDHEAVTQIPAPSKDMVGKIIDVIEKGYKLGEKVIRYPKVVIGK
ncbi:MAG: nucleotide exchange factor GrpE [Bacteroidota bacterium]|nr:nucleotide exchange factor GrpE [Bacteroidota bacterium]